MTREAVIFGLAGTLFGLLVGWIIGSQQAKPAPAPVQTTAAAQPQSSAGAPEPPPIDLQRASQLEQQAKSSPKDAAVRAQLGNLYFDSDRCDLAIPWYEAAFALNAKDINVSTDLAVCYYYTNNPDRALKQLAQSLAIDPRHPKTLLNQGIIRAFGKQDLAGAQESWEAVVKAAPNSPEAARAKQGLDSLRAAHAAAGASGGSAGRKGP